MCLRLRIIVTQKNDIFIKQTTDIIVVDTEIIEHPSQIQTFVL